MLTTHSPFVLDELPLEARAYIIKRTGTAREIVYGVSSEFAMSKMDDVPHTECDLFVEDERAATLVVEILTAHKPGLVHRCRAVPYGAASVGRALGIMNSQNRWPRPTCVFLDADAEIAPGCTNLPGKGAPETEVFSALQQRELSAIATRTGRPFSDVADAISQAMALDDHHEWVRYAASKLLLSSDTLWQAMCADWASNLHPEVAKKVITPIEDILTG